METIENDDLRLMLLQYQGGDFPIYSTNYYLLNKLNNQGNLYKLLKIQNQVFQKLNGNLISPVSLENDRLMIKEFIAEIESVVKDESLQSYEKITSNLILTNLYYLIKNQEESNNYLNKIQINLRFEENSVYDNYLQYCSIKRMVLSSLINNDIKSIETFLNDILINLPINSNLNGKKWLKLLFNKYFKLLIEEKPQIEFSDLLKKLKNNKLVLIILSNYYYLNFKKYLSQNFQIEFDSFFKGYYEENIVKSSITNEYLENLILQITEIIKERNSLIDLNFFEKVIEFSLSKTYQSIKITYGFLSLKFLNFNDSKESLLEIFNLLKNFEFFNNTKELKLEKTNFNQKLLEFNNLLLIELYEESLQFFYKIDKQEFPFSNENLNFLSELEVSLKKKLLIEEEINNLSESSTNNDNNILKLKLSTGYYSIILKKKYFLKINHHNQFNKFLNDKTQLLEDFNKCLSFNNYHNPNYYFEYLIILLKFFNENNQSILEIVKILKKILTKDLKFWKGWNLLLILINSNFGIESLIGKDFQNIDYIWSLMINYIKSNSDTWKPNDDLEINQLKNDLVELKITQIRIFVKTNPNNEKEILEQLSELFELSNLLSLEIENKVIKNTKTSKVIKANPKLFTFKGTFKKKREVITTTTTTTTTNNKEEVIRTNQFNQKLLQKIWLFSSEIYLTLFQYKECETSIVESEKIHKVNEFTSFHFAKLIYYSNLNEKKLIEKRLMAINEFNKSLNFKNNYNAIIGLSLLILKEDEQVANKQVDYVNDLNNLNDDESINSFELENNEPLIFLNDNDKLLTILRLKSLIETYLLNSYDYFDDELMFNCLIQIYEKINDKINYEKVLENVVMIQENELLRNLNCFDYFY